MKESAWEIFGRLQRKYGTRLYYKVMYKIGCSDLHLINKYPKEKEAREILQQIEKELKV